jgi:predicted alpha/beta superfamily hydrolase
MVAVAWVSATPALAQDQTLSIRSDILDADRPVHVRLPDGYEESSDSYPVLYMTDGEGIDRRAMPIIESLIQAGAIPELIVVGIPHQGKRGTDLTPTSTADRPGSGGGELFLRFVDEELVPEIEARYRTGSIRLLFGHSLGGLLSAFALVRDRMSFDGFIASSPVIAWDDWYVRERAAAAFDEPSDWDVFLFLSVGSEEPERFLERGREFAAWLEVHAPDELDWSFRVYEGEDHMSAALPSLRDGLTEFFAR